MAYSDSSVFEYICVVMHVYVRTMMWQVRYIARVYVRRLLGPLNRALPQFNNSSISHS
jgi:hypothetical protein